MPLCLLFTPSFYRSLKHFDPQQQKIIALGIEALKVYFASGNALSEAHKVTPRFFYKKLQHDFHEAGVEGKLRILLRKDGLKRFALIAGNHDQVKKFLAHS